MFVAIAKQSWLELIIIILLVAVSGLTGYEIGRQSLSEDKLQVSNYASANTDPSDAINKIETINNNVANFSTAPNNLVSNDDNLDNGERYVVVYGSVNGSKYYNYGCKSGDRIKDENRVYFANEGQALLAGYEPAANCDFSV